LLEVDIVAENGVKGRGAAPTGQSVGMWESTVLRDGAPKHWKGLTVHQAVRNVETEIRERLVGMDAEDPRAIDRALIELDGTERKSRLGGNAVYSTSIAAWRLSSALQRVPLYQYLSGGPLKTVPIPSFNMVNGGKYSDLSQAFNEFIVMPYLAESIDHAVEMSVLVFERLAKTLEDYLGHEPEVAKSYGYKPPSADPAVVLSLMQDAINSLGWERYFAFGLDCASSEFYDSENATYLYDTEQVDADELIERTAQLTKQFNFLFIEDVLDENDWTAWPKAAERLTNTILLGDDLIVTNRRRLQRAVETKAVGGFILKPNQIGTLTEALETYQYAQEHNLLAVPSGRSGGVIDDVVMDLSVGLQVPFQKNGAPRSGERIEKLNFLIRAAENGSDVKLSDLSQIVKF